MKQTWRQLQAMTLLVLRAWYRMGPRLRGGRKPEPTRGVSALLMRLVFAALVYNFGFTSSLRIARLADPMLGATWAALGTGSFVLAVTLALELPSPRMPAQALKSDLLEILPISPISKLVLLLGQAALMLPLGLGLAISLHSELALQTTVLSAFSFGLLHFLCFALLGACTGKLLKRTLSTYRASRLSWLATVPSLCGLLLLQLSSTSWLQHRPPVIGVGLGRALISSAPWRDQGVLAAVAFALMLLFLRLERGHELSEPVRPGPTASAFSSSVDMRKLERVLNQREPGGASQVPVAVAFLALLVGYLSWSLPEQAGNRRLFWNMVALFVLQLVSTLGMQRANRSVARDMLARPLLGTLPIAPSATLAAKVATLRSTLLLVAAPLLLALGAAHGQRAWLPELGWRVALSFVAVATYGAAAIYVAFLTTGLGAVRPQGGALGSLESFVLTVPFASVLFAPGPGSALISLLTLAALSFEARRAALQTIDWLDDAERDPGTEVWRALLVFGGFQGAQLLVQQLSSLFSTLLSATEQMLSAYLVSAAALFAMSARQQETDRPMHRARLAPLGLVVGALSASFAWLYLRWLKPTHDASSALQLTSGTELLLAAVAIVGVAPIVEERFFRGWLQPALARSLGARSSWAPVLAGLAFAAAHPAYSFAPVLVLGLLNGWLMQRFRSLSACMVAHALHNALALYLAR